MPWTPADAKKHTKKARTPHLKRLWANVANSVLSDTGREDLAVQSANAKVAENARKRRK